MERQKSIEVHINNLIALCHILDDFKDFDDNLEAFEICKKDINEVSILREISLNNFVAGYKNIKRFYQENQKIIDKINNYSSISDFLMHGYILQGKLGNEDNLNCLYQYVLDNKEHMDSILTLLGSVKALGFERLKLNEDLDFKNEVYKAYQPFSCNFDITYLDNIEIIPNYKKEIIEYTTAFSNYKLTVKVGHNDLSRYGKTIVVNSLLFDPKRLPEKVSKEFTFDKIIQENAKQKENYKAIRNSVDLSIGVDELFAKYNMLSGVTEKIDNVQLKEELSKTLKALKEDILKLNTLSRTYDDDIATNSDVITIEKLQKEKNKCLGQKNLHND